MSVPVNDNLVLIVGKASCGKSMSLKDLKNPEGVMYLNCENGKKLPFKHKFDKKGYVITNPMQIFAAFDAAEKRPDIHTIVVDSLTYLMDMYESMFVVTATNTMQAWGQFAQYFKTLMQTYVARSTKNVIFTAHVKDELNEGEMVRETMVPIKGSIKNNGVESYFSCIIAAKKVKLKDLEGYESKMLNITERDQMLGYKYVFQTQITKETVNERLRGPLDLFAMNETFIDNNVQMVLDRLHEYYDDESA